jgi:general stress protein 26
LEDAKDLFLNAVGESVPFLCSLASVEADGTPHVRFVRAKVDRDLTLRIPTFDGTGKTRQIREDPRVHITCGETRDGQPGTYFQIAGTAEITSDTNEREAAWTDRLSKFFSDPQDSNYVVVKVKPSSIVALPIGRPGKPAIWTADD